MILAPTPILQFFDGNGVPLVGGLLFTYEAATTTKQACFTDASGDTALPNPIVLNARGEVAPSGTGTSCGCWLDPALAYKFVLCPPTAGDPPTSTIWTVDDVVSPQTAILSAIAEYEATIGGVPIGSIVAWPGATASAGWLLCYGQAVSRTVYALLFAVIGIAYGAGDASTTFNLPDFRGRYPLGADNMGGSPADRVTQAVSGILATTLGSTGGDQNSDGGTLTAASTALSGVSDPGHLHTFATQGLGGGAADGIPNSEAGGTAPDGATRSAFTNISVTTTVTTTVTSDLTGASQNMPPVQVTNYQIFTGVAS